jgi:hypothetical protein
MKKLRRKQLRQPLGRIVWEPLKNDLQNDRCRPFGARHVHLEISSDTFEARLPRCRGIRFAVSTILDGSTEIRRQNLDDLLKPGFVESFGHGAHHGGERVGSCDGRANGRVLLDIAHSFQQFRRCWRTIAFRGDWT